MDAGVESPLDVLSRAATMIQETQQQEDAAAAAKSQKQLPTMKWKRDRRTKPDYLRKSDPKYPPESNESSTEKSSLSSSSSTSTSPTSMSPTLVTAKSKTNGHTDAPLDMTTSQRQRGLPPSYSQAISDPSYRSTYTNNTKPFVNGRDELPSGISMCDPIIDEHFRRSLGKDYNAVFNNNTKEAVVRPPVVATKTPVPTPKQVCEKPVTPPVTSVIEMMDTTGLSVDDHFAKALGETWHKLNATKNDSKSEGNNTKTNNITSVNKSVTSSQPEVVST